MIKAALTGSIGMGKSTVTAMLRDLGIPVFDADAEVHRLQGPGGALLGAIEAAFPGSTGPNGVDRQELGDRALHDDAALAALEAIVHPAVAEARLQFLEQQRSAPLVVFDIPLLFERGGERDVDVILLVSAPAAVQRARVMARPGMTPAKFEAIFARQLPDQEKRLRADYVIETGVPLAETKARVVAVVACLMGPKSE